MLPNDIRGLIRSMATAIIVGLILAFISISTFLYFSNAHKNTVSAEVSEDRDIQKAIMMSNEEEPTFSTHISNEIIYSSENDFTISERKDGALPVASKKNITAQAYSVINISNDQTILQKNQNTLMPIASITKLITAVVSRKSINQNKSIYITPGMMANGNNAKFKIGEKFTVGELLYPLLLISSNDAAEALAISSSGGRNNFIKEMNDWASSIGAYSTHFSDPSGLSPDNLSSSKDIAIITNWILKNDPEIFNITLTKLKTLRSHTWINPTNFLNLTVYAGGKNGYTLEANRTGISLFKIGKQKKLFAVILLGSSTRDNDTLDLLDEAVM